MTTDAPGDLTVTRRKTLPLGRVLLEGDLSAIPLPDVLSFIAMIRRSGNLIVRKGDRVTLPDRAGAREPLGTARSA